ncbi:DUF6783 domain-containing protein [Anaerobutyricum hallii]
MQIAGMIFQTRSSSVPC